MAWWREGVFYEIYPRSFADSNGDGIGDLRGIAAHLDHLEWLGVDGVWLNPTFPSPNVDWGYDVSDYRDVHPDLGTLADLDALVADAASRNIRILLDLVPNHTSLEHPWFRTRPDFYVWANEIPNNWLAAFGGGPAWTLDPERRMYYLHNFAPAQPDLDWWNPQVRAEFEDIIRFWLDRGIGGFRIDVANALVKDRELRDNPDATEADDPWSRRRGFSPLYNANRPEVHEIFHEWRAIADEYEPPRCYVGEAWVWNYERWAEYWGTGSDELHMLFDFRLLFADLEADSLRTAVEQTNAALPSDGWPALAGSNHDVVRFPTRWCDGDPDRIRCALLMLLALRGTPFIYYGDEIGMTATDVPPDSVLDVAEPSRDPARTPMQWTAEPGAGFTEPGVEPWLPFGDTRAANVADQRDDPGSILRFCRDAIAFRKRSPDLRTGAYRSLDAPAGVWAWRRGNATTVALNLGPGDAELVDVTGTIGLATRRDREGERVDGPLRLAPAEGVVVA